VLETGDECCIVGDVIAGNGAYGGLEQQLTHVLKSRQGVALKRT